MTWAQHRDATVITRFAGHRLSVLHHCGPGIFRIGDRVRCSAGYLTVTSAIVGDAVLRHVATSNSWRRDAGSGIIDSADGLTSLSSHVL